MNTALIFLAIAVGADEDAKFDGLVATAKNTKLRPEQRIAALEKIANSKDKKPESLKCAAEVCAAELEPKPKDIRKTNKVVAAALDVVRLQAPKSHASATVLACEPNMKKRSEASKDMASRKEDCLALAPLLRWSADYHWQKWLDAPRQKPGEAMKPPPPPLDPLKKSLVPLKVAASEGDEESLTKLIWYSTGKESPTHREGMKLLAEVATARQESRAALALALKGYLRQASKSKEPSDSIIEALGVVAACGSDASGLASEVKAFAKSTEEKVRSAAINALAKIEDGK